MPLLIAGMDARGCACRCCSSSPLQTPRLALPCTPRRSLPSSCALRPPRLEIGQLARDQALAVLLRYRVWGSILAGQRGAWVREKHESAQRTSTQRKVKLGCGGASSPRGGSHACESGTARSTPAAGFRLARREACLRPASGWHGPSGMAAPPRAAGSPGARPPGRAAPARLRSSSPRSAAPARHLLGARSRRRRRPRRRRSRP